MSHPIKRTTALGLNIVFRSQRVFTITYYCESCPNEFTDEMLTVSHSYCPCCDAKCEPGTIEESEEELPEFDLSDEGIDPREEEDEARRKWHDQHDPRNVP